MVESVVGRRVALLAGVLLGLAVPVLAQDRPDLTGTWTLRPDPTAPGSVTFSGRAPSGAGDVYAMTVTLPDGTSRALSASFDGTTLRTSPAPDGAAGVGAPPATGPSVGLVAVIADAPGTTSETGATAAPSAAPGAAASEGRYALTTVAASGGSGRTALAFKATTPVDPAGLTPVERFGRPVTPIASVELTSVTFTSDHGLLTDHASSWDAGGSTFPEPEWTAARQHPISHTMDAPVSVKVELTVGPADCNGAQVTLVGDGPDGADFRRTVELKAGKNTVELTSTGRLARRVQRLAFDVRWSVEGVPAGVGVQPASTSTPLFVTFGTPTATGNAPGFTLKRMQKAIEAVSATNSLDPHAIVRTIISKWGHYNLRVAFWNAWELAEDKVDASGRLVGADCQTIVRFTRDMIQQVGVPGQADWVVIYAHCKEPTKGLESLNAQNFMTRPIQYHNDHFPRKWNRSSWYAVLVDGDGGRNNYEAALKFTHDGVQKYYPGGVNAVMDTPDQIIRVFTTMSWVSGKDIKDTIHAYR